jgi:hypothetical protein
LQRLKNHHKDCKVASTGTVLKELHPSTGLMIDPDELLKIHHASKTLPILSRHLFRHFFTVEEMTTHSLFGRKCNAIKDNLPPLPEIDPHRRNAIFGE